MFILKRSTPYVVCTSIARLFHETSLQGIVTHVKNASSKEIIKLITRSTQVYSQTPSIIFAPRENKRSGVIGDLHGDLEIAINAVNKFLSDEVEALIFLGDYIDRGEYGIETLLFVLSLALQYPTRVILLKGNHEDFLVYSRYGFLSEVTAKFTERGDKFIHELLQAIDSLFDVMPLACISVHDSFCVHGGIPIDAPRIEDIQEIPKPYSTIKKEPYSKLKQWLDELLWNDPLTTNNRNYSMSPRGSGVYRFGRKVLEEFLGKNKLKRVIRGHEAKRGKYEELWEKTLIHVHPSRFSSYNDPRQTPVMYIDFGENGYQVPLL